MSLRRVRRTPAVLLGMLVLTILFPRSCEQARVAVGAWLPGTAPVAPAAPNPLPAEETAALRQRVAELEAQRATLPTSDGPLAWVRSVERPARPAPGVVVARVLRRDLSASRRTFLVDSGKLAGVRPSQPVVHGNSFVGIVRTVSDGGARVLRIDDRSVDAAFPAAVLRGDRAEGAALRGQGVARGLGDGTLRITLLPSDGAQPGDFVVTGSGGNLVPEGLLVGVVVAFGDDDRDGAFEATVHPVRDLDSLKSVAILLTEGTGLRESGR